MENSSKTNSPDEQLRVYDLLLQAARLWLEINSPSSDEGFSSRNAFMPLAEKAFFQERALRFGRVSPEMPSH